MSQTNNDHPLGLTVHSMPESQDAEGSVDQASRRTSGRWKMIGVMLCCAAPVIMSYFTYYVIRPEGRRNFGVLIDPQRPTPDGISATPAFPGSTGTESFPDLKSLKGQWLLVSVSGGTCAPPCEENLYLQRQLRETTGREKDRVDWVWLVDDAAPVPERMIGGLKTAKVLRVDHARLAQWLAPAEGHALADHIYVVDPMGNWMMRFPAPLSRADAKKAKADITRLLAASASWDNEGR